MTQKPVLRAEVYARALRASQNVLTSESGGRATQWAIELSFHLESNVALATHNHFCSGLDPLLELNQKLVFRSVPRRVWERAGRLQDACYGSNFNGLPLSTGGPTY
jgi:hypothetical protein